MIDFLLIILRCVVLLVLVIVSQLALHRRQYPLALWTFAFWLTIFRLLAIRVLRVYAHPEDPQVGMILNQIMTGWFSVVTDFILVFSAIPMFYWIKKTYQEWKSELES